ncbi:MAG: hypothetical protein EAZ08_07395 [Cytophagales bacterium]|nr:MAG: hypothetical protein EAZ08_07395 [Cytophagales bacterium]
MKQYFLVVWYFWASTSIFAQNSLVKPRPEPASFANDYAEVLSASDEQRLEEKLKQYEKATSHQFAIVIIPSLQGNNLEKLTNEWFKTWGIGQKEKNNGLLILLAVKERKVRIEVGYGLEKIIPATETTKVIDNYLRPNFKNGNFYQGFDEAIAYLMELAQKETSVLPQPTANATQPNAGSGTANSESEYSFFDLCFDVAYVGIFLFICMKLYKWLRKPKKYATHTTDSTLDNDVDNIQGRNMVMGELHKNSNASSFSSDDSSSSSDTSSSDSSFGGGDSGGGGSSGDW